MPCARLSRRRGPGRPSGSGDSARRPTGRNCPRRRSGLRVVPPPPRSVPAYRSAGRGSPGPRGEMRRDSRSRARSRTGSVDAESSNARASRSDAGRSGSGVASPTARPRWWSCSPALRGRSSPAAWTVASSPRDMSLFAEFRMKGPTVYHSRAGNPWGSSSYLRLQARYREACDHAGQEDQSQEEVALEGNPHPVEMPREGDVGVGHDSRHRSQGPPERETEMLHRPEEPEQDQRDRMQSRHESEAAPEAQSTGEREESQSLVHGEITEAVDRFEGGPPGQDRKDRHDRDGREGPCHGDEDPRGYERLDEAQERRGERREPLRVAVPKHEREGHRRKFEGERIQEEGTYDDHPGTRDRQRERESRGELSGDECAALGTGV